MRQARRRFLAGLATAAVGIAGCSRAPANTDTDTDRDGGTSPSEPRKTTGSKPTPSGEIPETVGLETVADGFTSPVAFVDPPGEHRYVADQTGQVYVVGSEGRLGEPALDLADSMVNVSGYDERGLLGLALHPSFADTRKVYVRYSSPPREGTPSGYSHTFVLSEFRASDDGTRIRRDTERTLLEIPEPQSNHNAGAITFGPDDHLYVAVGDGGGANDVGTGHVEDWYAKNPGGNGQDVQRNLLGSLLRIDPDGRTDGKPYGIPDDNPLVGKSGLDEHYAWGLRNPWRMSFAGEELFVADVGQNRYEEVDLVRKGGNYGWNVREGTHCFGAETCPATSGRGNRLREPIVEYDHGGEPPNGIAVIGGYLYRGDAISRLRGQYLFGDWQAGGKLFVASRSEDDQWPVEVIDADPAGKLRNLLAFGEDRAGELYVLTSKRGGVSGNTGALHRIVPA